MNNNLEKLNENAIHASLTRQWPAAIDLNQHILQLQPNNISALNRLAKAYEETGELEKAAKSYRKVLKLDKYSRIARNNLDRLQNLKSIPHKPSDTTITQPFSFIEEPGLTKTVFLTKLAPAQILATLRVSQPVSLKPKGRRLSVTADKTYLGYLPDDLSAHLLHLLKLGNKYEAAIKNITKNELEIFIRETKKSARLKGLPSFTLKDTQKYYQFLPSEPIAESPLEIETNSEEL